MRLVGVFNGQLPIGDDVPDLDDHVKVNLDYRCCVGGWFYRLPVGQLKMDVAHAPRRLAIDQVLPDDPFRLLVLAVVVQATDRTPSLLFFPTIELDRANALIRARRVLLEAWVSSLCRLCETSDENSLVQNLQDTCTEVNARLSSPGQPDFVMPDRSVGKVTVHCLARDCQGILYEAAITWLTDREPIITHPQEPMAHCISFSDLPCECRLQW